MPGRKRLRVSDVLERVFNDSDSDLSPLSSDSDSESLERIIDAEDEGTLPHPPVPHG